MSRAEFIIGVSDKGIVKILRNVGPKAEAYAPSKDAYFAHPIEAERWLTEHLRQAA